MVVTPFGISIDTRDGHPYSPMVVTPFRITIDSFEGYASILLSIEIPKGVTTIVESAFYGCTSLKAIVIRKGVTTIGESAFAG